MHYDEQLPDGGPATLLVAYSDGVTEPDERIRKFGEDAGGGRQPLPRPTLHLISTHVMLALAAWIAAEEQPTTSPLVARPPVMKLQANNKVENSGVFFAPFLRTQTHHVSPRITTFSPSKNPRPNTHSPQYTLKQSKQQKNAIHQPGFF